MKIGIVQCNLKIGDFCGNMDLVVQGYRDAVQQGAQLVVASELALFGYPPGDMLLRSDYLNRQNAALDELSRHIGDAGLIVGVATSTGLDAGLPLFNSAVLIQNGTRAHAWHKSLLPNYDVFDERRYFEPSRTPAEVITYHGRRLGVLICEDIWNDLQTEPLPRRYRQNPVDSLAGRPIDLLVTINASPFYLGKPTIRMDIARSISARLGCPLVYANQVGGNDELVFDGRSFAVNAEGTCIAMASAFEPETLCVDLSTHDSIKITTGDKLEDLYNALIVGTRDYVCKSVGNPSVLIALSGGIDSAVTACIAARAVGPEHVHGFGLPSSFSSEGSIADARQLAERLGIAFDLIPIGKSYVAIGHTLEPIIGWGMPGARRNDVTEENVQARIRGAIIMAVSNRIGGIVLSTGNKSELSVGYCTLYGDMVGGFAVLSDVFKSRVYELARYINRHSEIIPWSTIDKPPSAELRPDQKDEDTLPPYDMLDAVLDAYIEKGLEAQQIAMAGFDRQVVDWIIAKVTANEYKRRQMAPGLKVTRKAFGSGRRMPIAATL